MAISFESPRNRERLGGVRSVSRIAMTMVEVLVVVAVIGVLVALLLPAIQVVRESARLSQCQNNLKQVALGIDLYSHQYKSYPPGRVGCDCEGEVDTEPVCFDVRPESRRPGTGGLVGVLPFSEHQNLFQQFGGFAKGAVFPAECTGDGSTDGWDAPVLAALATRPPLFGCPSDPGDRYVRVKQIDGSEVRIATGSYAMVLGSQGATLCPDRKYDLNVNNDGAFGYVRQRRPSDVTDGLSNTMFLGEAAEGDQSYNQNLWMLGVGLSSGLRSTEVPLNTDASTGPFCRVGGLLVNGPFRSPHRGGGLFAFGDGSVRFVSESISLPVYRAMSTIDLGEVLPSSD